MRISNLNFRYPIINNNIHKLIKKSDYEYSFSLSSVSFKNAQKEMLTDIDYKNAQQNLRSVIKKAKKEHCKTSLELYMLDTSKINGLQKDIKVFEGLTMKEIAFVLTNPNLLLNRGCSNNCVHCGYMALPKDRHYLNRLSYEDFKLFLEGVKELDNRLGSDVSACTSIRTFGDSDCMEIELTDAAGKNYDYTDCLEEISNSGFDGPLFDTCGWAQNSEKMQKRAEKFVEYIIKPENQNKVSSINISLNPFHSIVAKSTENAMKAKLFKAHDLLKKYIDRMANVLYTFTPILDTNIRFHFLARTLSSKQTNTLFNDKTLAKLQASTLKRLKKMYLEDLNSDKKCVKSMDDIDRYMRLYSGLIKGADTYQGDEIVPWGRAENLFKKPVSTFDKRKEITENKLKYNEYRGMEQIINPNGRVSLLNKDITVPTDITLNFQNKEKETRVFAHQISDLEYIAEKRLLIKQ